MVLLDGTKQESNLRNYQRLNYNRALLYPKILAAFMVCDRWSYSSELLRELVRDLFREVCGLASRAPLSLRLLRLAGEDSR
mmetsp:Transcript_14499/g.23057  ORF Transcript_14499/g.23057 Transcript_14499/m.23057 type:complete len:81 (+) Transcript_14499:163-405(+)